MILTDVVKVIPTCIFLKEGAQYVCGFSSVYTVFPDCGHENVLGCNEVCSRVGCALKFGHVLEEHDGILLETNSSDYCLFREV